MHEMFTSNIWKFNLIIRKGYVVIWKFILIVCKELFGYTDWGLVNCSIRWEDCDSLRFLWVDSLVEKEPKAVVLRFIRVMFRVSSRPYLLNATLRQHLEKFVSVQLIAYHSHCMLTTGYVDQAVKTKDTNWTRTLSGCLLVAHLT